MRFNKRFDIVEGLDPSNEFDRMVIGLEEFQLNALSSAVISEFHTSTECFSIGFEENVVVRVFRRIYEFLAGLFRRIRELFTRRKGKEKIEKAKEIVAEVKKADEVTVPASRALVPSGAGKEEGAKNEVAVWRAGKQIGDVSMQVKPNERWLFGDATKSNISDMLQRADTAIEIGNEHIVYLTKVINSLTGMIRSLLTKQVRIGEADIAPMGTVGEKHAAATSTLLKRLNIPAAVVVKPTTIDIKHPDVELKLDVVSVKPQTYVSSKDIEITLSNIPQESEIQAVGKRYAESVKLQELITKSMNEVEANKKFFEQNSSRIEVADKDDFVMAVSILDAASRSSTLMVEGIVISEAAVGTMMSIMGDLKAKTK